MPGSDGRHQAGSPISQRGSIDHGSRPIEGVPSATKFEGDAMSDRFEGGRLSGAVRFVATGQPKWVSWWPLPELSET